MERPISDFTSVSRGSAQRRAEPEGSFQEAARSQGRQWVEKLKRMIIDYPGASLGMALGMGVLLGWLIKRR
jgi:ElaB/YqjD/DUF883 family membrane-anchored ribosome-binding protein